MPILIVVLVVVLVVGIVLAAFFAYYFIPLSRTPIPTAPSVVLGSGGFVAGNATFVVTSVSSATQTAFFHVNLRVGSTIGTPHPIEPGPGNAVVGPSMDRFRVYFVDGGSNSLLDVGDRFTVAGDGTPLPEATSFEFYLVWIFDGKPLTSIPWTTPGQGKPSVTFTSVTQSSGKVTIGVAGASQSVSPSNYKVNLAVGTTTGAAVAMPTMGGFYVALTISGTTYRIYWTDIGGEKTVNSGDTFRVTGNNVALPAATSFTFYLLWGDGSSIQSTPWSTP